MPYRKLSPALEKIARGELNEDAAKVPEAIKTIKEWLNKQPHITANEDDNWILSFLRGCKFDIEKAKEKLEAYYTGRTAFPEALIGCDPETKYVQEYLKTGFCWTLKEPVSADGEVVLVLRPGFLTMDIYDIMQLLQLNMMFLEILQLENDHVSVAGMRFIVDLTDVTFRHMISCTPSIAKQLAKFTDKRLPIRIKGIHYINAPFGMQILYALLTLCLSSKLLKRVHVHGKNSDGLYEFVPRHLMPKEYEGDGGTVAELSEIWQTKFLNYRDYFLKAANYKTDESKRIKKQKDPKLEKDPQQPLRDLSID